MAAVMGPVRASVMCPVSRAVMSAETLIAGPDSLRTIVLQGVPPGGRVSISGDGLSYLLTLHRVWSLGEGVMAISKKAPAKNSNLSIAASLLVNRCGGTSASTRQRVKFVDLSKSTPNEGLGRRNDGCRENSGS